MLYNGGEDASKDVRITGSEHEI